MAHKAMQGFLVRVPCWAAVDHAINGFPLPPCSLYRWAFSKMETSSGWLPGCTARHSQDHGSAGQGQACRATGRVVGLQLRGFVASGCCSHPHTCHLPDALMPGHTSFDPYWLISYCGILQKSGLWPLVISGAASIASWDWFFIRADGFPVTQMVPEPPGTAAHQSLQHGFPEAHGFGIHLQAGDWTPHSTGSNPSSSRSVWCEAWTWSPLLQALPTTAWNPPSLMTFAFGLSL